MKLSNSKKQLAKIISENGGWRDGAAWALQSKKGSACGRVVFISQASQPKYEWGWQTNQMFSFGFDYRLLKNWHQTILSRDEYFHLYPAQDDEGWIEWEGGECPVHSHRVDVKFREGSADDQLAHTLDWSVYGDNDDGDIIAYRLHKPEPEVETPKPERVVIEQKPTLEQLAADYRNRQDYAERKQQEADEAKAEAEAKLAELVAAGKAVGLVVSVVAPEPELVITDWRDLQVGDEVEYISGASPTCSGMTGFVTEIDAGDPIYRVRVSMLGRGESWCSWWRFVRRP